MKTTSQPRTASFVSLSRIPLGHSIPNFVDLVFELFDLVQPVMFVLCQGQRSTLENDNSKLRRRLDERAKDALEEERKYTALARECGTVKTQLEAVSAVCGA